MILNSWNIQGWSISIDRRKDGRRIYYRNDDPSFSINNQLLNEEEELKLKEVLLTLSRFKGMPQFINFELISLLFSFGEAITVLQPKSIIDIIKSKAKEVTKNYS